MSVRPAPRKVPRRRIPDSALTPGNGHIEAAAPDSLVPILHRPRHLARRLDLTRQSIYNLIKSGELESVPVCGSMRVPETSVLAYLERCGFKVRQ